VVEVIRLLPHVVRNALVVHLAAAVDVLLQPLVEILVLAPLLNLPLVVQLDLGDEQACESPRLVVLFPLLGCRAAKRRAAADVRPPSGAPPRPAAGGRYGVVGRSSGAGGAGGGGGGGAGMGRGGGVWIAGIADVDSADSTLWN